MSPVKSHKARFFLEPEITNNINLFLKNFERSSCSIPKNYYGDRQKPSRNTESKNTQNQNVIGTAFHSFRLVQ